MRRREQVILVALAVGGCGGERPRTAERNGVMKMSVANGASVLELIKQLAAFDPLDADTVEAFFGIELEVEEDEDEEEGNRYSEVFVGEAPDYYPFEEIELRVPTTEAEVRGSLLILSTRANGRIPAGDLHELYGPPERVEVPRAGAPADEPTYEVYEQDWGTLSFGYLPAEGNVLLSIVIDRQQVED
jgi:hypothetical protein